MEVIVMKKIVLFLLVFLWAGSSPLFATTVEIMDKDELKGILDSSDIVIFDVRTGKDWSSSEYKIKGAVRLEADGVDSAAEKYGKEKTLVFYCA
jgi:rhodanese-related sulfurtransferase